MIAIIGKNGAGKSFLANKLYHMGFHRSVGVTTRPMRNGEINGIDYFFVSNDEFEERIRNGEFIDYKMRNGYYYGISRANINDSTILVSGDTRKIEMATGLDILKLYIDCDLLSRYSRVLSRNDLMQNIFNRFHTENFAYLYDFDALFINNDFNNNESLEQVLGTIASRQKASEKLISNRSFIEYQLSAFDVEQIRGLDDKLLLLLKFEEYLLRKFFLENKDLSREEVIKKYYDILLSFLEENEIYYKMCDGKLYVIIDKEEYNFDYKIRRKVM